MGLNPSYTTSQGLKITRKIMLKYSSHFTVHVVASSGGVVKLLTFSFSSPDHTLSVYKICLVERLWEVSPDVVRRCLMCI